MTTRLAINADCWIRHLRLRPHPKGGWYRESYHAAGTIPRAALPRRYRGPRAYATAIYFLLAGRDFSAFHRIHSDEAWHFYHGRTLELFDLAPDGRLRVVRLGARPAHGDVPQAVMPHSHWFAARLAAGRGHALVGCTVAPGFDFADLELAQRARLCARFPKHKKIISELTRGLAQRRKGAKKNCFKP